MREIKRNIGKRKLIWSGCYEILFLFDFTLVVLFVDPYVGSFDCILSTYT